MRLGLLLSFGLIYSSVAADLNFIAGSGVTINATNKGNGNADLEFSMTPGVGAGDVTTLQLLTVSNLLWNINYATSNYFAGLPSGGGGEVSTAQLLVVSNQMIASSNALWALNNGTTNSIQLLINSSSNALYAIETTRNAAVSNGVVSLLVANDTTTSNGIVSLLGSMGGGDVTTAQLLTVSNQVQAASNSISGTAQTIANGVTNSSIVRTNDTTWFASPAYVQSVTNGVLRTNGVTVDGTGIVIRQNGSGGISLSNAIAAGSSTNQLVQTNGVDMGSVGTINWTSGVTGSVSGAVATLGVSASSTGGSTNLDTANIGWMALTNGLVQLRTNHIGEALFPYGLVLDTTGNVAIGTNGQSAALAIYGTNQYLLQIGSRRLAADSGGTNALLLSTNGSLTIKGSFIGASGSFASGLYTGSGNPIVQLGGRSYVASWVDGYLFFYNNGQKDFTGLVFGTNGIAGVNAPFMPMIKKGNGPGTTATIEITSATNSQCNLRVNGEISLTNSTITLPPTIFAGTTSAPSFAANNGSMYLSTLGEMWLMSTNWSRIK